MAPGPRKRHCDRHAMVFFRFGSGRQSWQLQASKASFLVGSESDVRHWHRGLGSAVGTGMPCEAWRLEPASFLVGSESNVTHWRPWQEVITSSKGKKQETRNKKQETRSQEATRRTRKRRRRRRRSVLHF